MAEIIILGSGSGFATSQRNCTAVALLTGRNLYLFDCGEPVGASLFRSGIDALALKTLFISHMHPDHVGGLASLLFSIYLPGRSGKRKFKPWSVHRSDQWYRDALWFPREGDSEGEAETSETRPAITIHMPEEGIEPIQAYLRSIYLPSSLLPFDLKFEPVEEGPMYDDGALTVASVPNDHLKGNFAYQQLRGEKSQQRLQSYSFAGEIGGHKFVFSGDIDRLAELNPLLEGAETLIVEVAHYDPEEIGPFVSALPLRRVILSHIHPGLEGRLPGLLAAWDDPRIEIAHDGLHIPLTSERST